MLQATHDRIEIEDLCITYAHALDSLDWDLIRTVLAPDAVLDYTSAGGPRGGIDDVVGWLSGSLGAFSMRMHYVSNVRVVVDGDRATSRAYFHAPLGVAKDGKEQDLLISGGTYDDTLVRTADGWRIAERVMTMLWMHGPVAARTDLRA